MHDLCKRHNLKTECVKISIRTRMLDNRAAVRQYAGQFFHTGAVTGKSTVRWCTWDRDWIALKSTSFWWKPITGWFPKPSFFDRNWRNMSWRHYRPIYQNLAKFLWSGRVKLMKESNAKFGGDSCCCFWAIVNRRWSFSILTGLGYTDWYAGPWIPFRLTFSLGYS